MSGQVWIALGSLVAGTAVATGAFAAHGLKDHLSPEYLQVFNTGAEYQMYHGIAIVLTGFALTIRPGVTGQVAAVAFLVGVILFSGSLYALTTSGIRMLGMITPFGGVSFMVGWAALAWHGWTMKG